MSQAETVAGNPVRERTSPGCRAHESPAVVIAPDELFSSLMKMKTVPAIHMTSRQKHLPRIIEKGSAL